MRKIALCILCLTIFLISTSKSFAATKNEKAGIAQDSLNKIEHGLLSLYDAIAVQQTDSAKQIANQKFRQQLHKAINSPHMLLFPFDSLDKKIAILDAPDHSFRIFNWTVYYQKGYYDYYGFILKKSADSVIVYPLVNQIKTLKNIETLTTSNEQWPGALYYDIIPSTDGQNPYYILLGWDGADLFVNKKLIDVLWFDDNHNPQFGKQVFQIGEELNSRMIFTFSEQTTMQLRWDKKINMIVFDHLSPSEPQYINNFEYYGPDFSYDALTYENGVWTLVEDVDIREPKNSGHKRQPKNK